MSDSAQTLGIAPPDPAAALGVGAPQLPDDKPGFPGLGPLPGQLFLNPQIAPQVQGNARPLAPGEYLMNPQGSWSSEMTYTVPYNGGYAVVPGMWIVDGKPVRVDEDQATGYAKQTGLNFQTYPDEATAEKASQAREDQWQTTQPQDAGKVAPLWSRPQSQAESPIRLVGGAQPSVTGAMLGILPPPPDLYAAPSGRPAWHPGPDAPVNDFPDWDTSLPDQIAHQLGYGGMTPDQSAAYYAAAQAHTAARENQNSATRERLGLGQTPSYGPRFTAPDDAANQYPAW